MCIQEPTATVSSRKPILIAKPFYRPEIEVAKLNWLCWFGKVSKVKQQEKLKYPPHPLSTIELEKRASRYFRMSSEQTMKVGIVQKFFYWKCLFCCFAHILFFNFMEILLVFLFFSFIFLFGFFVELRPAINIGKLRYKIYTTVILGDYNQLQALSSLFEALQMKLHIPRSWTLLLLNSRIILSFSVANSFMHLFSWS